MSTHRKLLQILSIVIILSMIFSGFSVPGALAQSGDGLKRQHNAQTGKVNFIGPESGRALPAAKALGISPSTRPADPALALAKRFGPEFGLKNPARDLKEVKNKRSNNSRVTVHYQQNYEGIPVLGGELIVNTNGNGDLYSISGEISPDLSLSTQPTIDLDQARQTALQAMAKQYQKTPEVFVASAPELWIYDESLLEPSTRPVELVWRMEVTPKDADMPVRELVLVNAERGNISLHFNQVDTAWTLSGKTDSAQDIQPTSTPQPTKTPLPTEVPVEASEAISTATPTPAPTQSDEGPSTLDSKHEAQSLTGSTWYVATTGNDSDSCAAPASPCATIQAAINKASSGDTIQVAEGTYYYTSINANPNVVIINKSITLSGGWQSDFSSQTGASVIDGENVNNGILANASGSTVAVEHFVIQRSRTGSDSGGIYLYAANFTLRNSSVINNTGGRGAGIFMIGNPSLSLLNSTVSGNVAGSSGAGIYAVNGTITTNNSTLAYNNSNGTGGGMAMASGTVTLRNSILAKNTAATNGPNCSGSISSSDHNIIENTAGCTVTSGTGDQFNVDPLIDSVLTGTLPLYALQTTSPAVNAGDNSTCLSTDQRGVARPQGSACDIGAYELVVSKSISVFGGSNQTAEVSTAFALPLSVLVIDEFGEPASGLTVTFTAPASGASGIFADTNTNSTTAITDVSGHATSAIITANNQPGSFTVNTTADGYSSPAVFSLGNFSTNFYVSPNGSDSDSCDSPALPCETINGAIGKAVTGSMIAVASGTYTGSGTEVVLINKSVTLSGGWDNTFSLQNGTSIIDGHGARRAVVNTATNAAIEGFTIQGGYHATQGGGISNTGTLSLRNSAVTGNKSGGSAGGIHNSLTGTLTLSDSEVSYNETWLTGSGIQNSGMLTINHTSISNNLGGTSGYSGGGGGAGIESRNGTVFMDNSSISGNTMKGSFQSSGIYNSVSSFALNNSTVSGNTGADAIYNSTGTLTLKNSTVSRNAKLGIRQSQSSGPVILQNSILANNSTLASGQDCAGTITSYGYNLISNTTGCTFASNTGDQTNVNPMLSTYWIGSPGYHTLLGSSPAIDAGNPATCLSTDQRGLARPQGAACDIGAYEYTTPGAAASLGITNGNNQRAGLSFPFALPLIVYAVDDAGSPVSGVEVTFTAPSSGPSGIFADSGTNVTTVSTNGDGVAISSTFTANSQLGAYQVTAIGTGLSGSVSFVLTNGAWFVSPTGNDSNSCSVPTAPCLTLNGAIAKAYSVDVIKVASGIYAPVSISKSLVVSGGWDTTFTSQTGYSTIQGSPTVNGISASGPNVSVSRFVIQGSQYGIYHNGGWLSFDRGALISNKNGVYNYGGDASFTNITISGNDGSGVSGSAINNYSGTVRLQFSTIAGNTGNYAIYSIYGGAYIEMGNSILAGNSGADCYIGNTNLISAGHNIFGRSPACSNTTSFVPDPTDQVGTDPQLSTFFPLGYYPVSSTSPAVDQGDPASCPATDQRSVSRPQGAACDIGAYEYTVLGAATSFGAASGSNQHSGPSLPFQLPLAVYVMDAFGSPVSGVNVTFTAPASGPSGSFADRGTNVTTVLTNSGGVAVTSTFTANSQLGSYNVIATAEGLAGSVSLALTNAAWFISPTGSNSNSCTLPSSPCLTINGAMGKAVNGDAILVAVGTYAPASISKNLTLLGGWDTTFTSQTGYSTIQGSPTSHGISTGSQNIFIARFIVQNSDYGIYHNSSSTGKLRFEQGALLNNHNGIYNYGGEITLINTTISGNNDGNTSGSAIRNEGGIVRIRYSTIADNVGNYAIYSTSSSARIEIGNSILAGNGGVDCYVGSTNLTSVGHNVFGRSPACSGPAGFVPDLTDQVGIDPQLSTLLPLGYHALLFTSPAVDEGNPATCPATDQRSVARPQGAACDIGAFEYVATPGEAVSFEIASGANQHSGPSLPFQLPLAVYVMDAFGSPVSGVNVTFTAPASGPSGTFTDTYTNTTMATTNDSGIATSSMFVANSQTGSYNVIATAEGLAGSASFALTNAVWFVAPTGNNSNSCSLPTSPCLTINGAMGKAVNGDAILVAVGTYAPASISKNLTLLGGWDTTFTSQTGYSTVEGTGSADGFSVDGQNVYISRFILRNNYRGIFHTSTGTLRFEQGASINNSHGLRNEAGDVFLTNITISGSTGTAITNNAGTVRIQYSTITSNTGLYAINSTNNDARIEIGNSILAGNSGADCYVGNTNLISVGHNIFGRSPACSNTTSFVPDPTDQVGTDPQLSTLLPPGYHALTSASPAVDEGNPASCPATDQRSVSRPQGAACDIGAYEYTVPGAAVSFGILSGSPQRSGPSLPFQLPLAVYVMDAFGSPVSGVNITFTAPASGPSGSFADRGTNVTTVLTNSGGVAVTSTFTANSQLGSYNVIATAEGIAGSVSLALTNAAWFVSPTGNDSNSCSLPTSPCLTIYSAIGKAVNGDAILVAVGTYTPIDIRKNLTLLGGWDTTFSSRIGYSIVEGDPDSYGHAISVDGQNVFISRFIAQNTYHGIYHGNFAGTLHFDQGALLNNGNGLRNMSGDVILTNTTISGNYVHLVQGTYSLGSAISNVNGLIRIQYSTITNNGGTEAIYSDNGSAQIEIGNSILAGNPGGDCDCYANITSVGHNILSSSPICGAGSDVVPHTTDLVAVDPKLFTLFPNGYHPLLPGSPAIDAADSLGCPAADQRGAMRPVGTACDIGAVEYTPTGTTPKYILAYQGSPQMIVINSAAASRLVAVVFDENGNSISGETVKFTAPAQGASVIFADTGTNTSTVVTDVNGLATSSAFTANNLAGSYSVVASVSGADTPAGFSLSNSTIALNPRIQTYTANNSTTLPGTFLCDQTELDCTNGWDVHADAAHQYAFGTYAFYAVQHNRNSIDNTGMTIVSSVHVSSGYANAGWTGSQMVYGDAYGFARADDVVAHELTHGVTQYESNLFYYYQSGAINESFSDLWGEYYDQTNGMGNDSLAVQWLVGEDVTGLGVIRSFSNPPDYGDPDKISSANYYTGTSDNGGVHTNSGVNNKAVFLMVQGGSFNGKTVAALGWEKTAAIYYEVNANLLSSGADYSDLYYALQQACTNLIGQNGITSSDCVEVRNAADAVEMNGQPVPEFNTDAPYCDLGASAVALFSDDLESGTGNWIVDSRWQLDSPYGRYAHSGNHSLYADDYPDDVADVSARLAAIPIPANAYLHFVHAYDFDAYETSGYYDDGGVLEYSLDGGSTWSDAGSLIDFNGYKGTIRDSESLGNPLRGRSAFVGSSHGYISTRLNLASLAGETVIFRWRMGLDVMGYVWGWWVDDVNVYRCVTDTSAPTVTSIVRASADPTSAASVDFTVTFSEPVIDVDANDFVLNTTGNIVGATITNITGSGSTWTVVVDTGSGDGTLGLNVPVGADIQDLAANSLGGLPFTGSEQYTIDKTAPVLSSMTTVGANPANAASVVFQVTFSEPVMGVDSGAFNLHIATGNITGAVIESVTANNSCVAYCDTHTVTVNTGSGSGTLELISISSAAVEDAAGNQLGSPPVYYSEYYTIDKTAPLVSSIVRASPDRTAAANVDFTVTFSEPVTGVNTTIPFSDFTPTTSGVTGAAITGVSGSDATWTVTVDTGSGDGTLGLDLTVDASITDPAGNLLEQGPFAPDEEYTIDKTHAFLVAPANGELLLYRRPTFDWSDVPDASGYRITASRSSSFSTMLWEVDAVDSTYTPSADLPGGQVIYWRVRAQLNDAWGPWSETWSFTTGNPPSVPGLSSPANASLTRDYTPLLNWNNSTVPSGAAAFDHYEVQVATDTLFTDPVLIDESTPTGQISASSYTPATDLAANTTYYWRVRSYNISGQYSNWSTVRSFRTALLPPSDLTPDDGVTVDSRKPALDWAVVEGAEGYNIQISTSSSFGSLLVNTSTTTDTFTPTSNLPAHRMIYWRVRTTGANGPSSWTTASFNTP